jgi:hypothetical protein
MKRRLLLVSVLSLTASASVGAQWRVGADSATRWTRFGREVVEGTVKAFAFAGVDQLREKPPEWGTGWRGYGRRLASNEGEFLVEESVTAGLAAALHRPLDYSRCTCRGTIDRLAWALKASVTDPLPDGRSPIAIPRIVGAFAGSFAQSTWRPSHGHDRTELVLVNGATSLAIGALVNVWREMK